MKKKVRKKKVAAIKRTGRVKKAAPRKNVSKKKSPQKSQGTEVKLRDKVLAVLEAAKAEHIVTADVRSQSSLTDFLIIASGRSSRQVKALAEHTLQALKDSGVRNPRAEGMENGDWTVVDGGDVIVHVFRPEVRAYYRLEEIWGLEPPLQETFKRL